MFNFPALNFHLGETIDMLRATVQQFAAAEIAPRAERSTATISFRWTSGARWAGWGSSG